MRVLIACEFSGIVRDAFRERGHYAVSCDLLPTEREPSHHFIGDVRNYFLMGNHLYGYWDLLIAFPPCTYLCNSGVRWLYRRVNGKLEHNPVRHHQMEESAKLFRALLDAPVDKIAIENPIMHKRAASLIGRGQDQLIQPWQYGHGETKATCLWLKNLPKLQSTEIVSGRRPRVHRASPGPDRWKERSRTLPGIAAAMAEQWGNA